jgi:hypothetical protein
MCETVIGYTLHESAWAWLLWMFGAKDASVLPVRGEQDLVQGKAWLVDAGLYLAENDYAAIEPAIAWVVKDAVDACWTLDIAPLDEEAFALLRCPNCFILAERIAENRLALIPLKDWHEAKTILMERVPQNKPIVAGIRDAKNQWQSGPINADQLLELFGQLRFQEVFSPQ